MMTMTKKDLAFLCQLLGLFLIMFLIATFSKAHITVDPDSHNVYAVESSWWGLSEKRRTIKWLKTSDYEFPCWMTKDKDGDFYCYIQEEFYFPEEYVDPY